MNIVHAGFQKCASSFLQQQIFPNISGYDCVVSSEWIQDWKGELPLKTTKNLILSCEGFTTFQLGNYSGLPTYPHEKAIHNIRRLLGTDTKILFVIRRQDDLFESYYRFKRDFSQTSDMFIDYPLHYRLKFYWGSRSRRVEYFRALDFCSQILIYEAIFGRDNIFILFYEDLVQSPGIFFSRLSEIFNQDLSHLLDRVNTLENVSDREGYVYSLPIRAINRLTVGGLGRLLPKKRKAVSASEKRHVLSTFSSNNKYLFHNKNLSQNSFIIDT